MRITGILVVLATGWLLFQRRDFPTALILSVFFGAGLGLAISRRIVRRMGSDISLAPRRGGGSVFAFVLDLAVVEAVDDAAPLIELRRNAGGLGEVGLESAANQRTGGNAAFTQRMGDLIRARVKRGIGEP